MTTNDRVPSAPAAGGPATGNAIIGERIADQGLMEGQWIGLSRDGAGRREDALPRLRRAVRWRGTRRQAGRGALVLLVGAGAVWLTVGGTRGAAVRPPHGSEARSPVVAAGRGGGPLGDAGAPVAGGGAGAMRGVEARAKSGVKREVVPASRGTLARVAIPSRGPSRVRAIGDDALIEALAAAGLRAGIVQGEGEASVLRVPELN